MKVLLRKNVTKLGKIGDLVEVKDGYARNYLLPCHLAVAPTEANLKAIEGEKQRYLTELSREQEQLEVRAASIRGKEVTIAAHANPEGQLYGSVGPRQIAEALNSDGGIVEPRNIILAEPIRQLDKYDVTVEFSDEVRATVHVWVVPTHEVAGDLDAETPEPPPAVEPEAEG